MDTITLNDNGIGAENIKWAFGGFTPQERVIIDSQMTSMNMNSNITSVNGIQTDKDNITPFIINISNASKKNYHPNESNSSSLEDNIVKPKHNRKAFSPEEDALIARLVQIHGTQKWDVISSFMNGRSARQCRERWKSFLSPGMVNGPWTMEEDKLLVKLHTELGSKWATISKNFVGRSDYNVKNRWQRFQRYGDLYKIEEMVRNDECVKKNELNNKSDNKIEDNNAVFDRENVPIALSQANNIILDDSKKNVQNNKTDQSATFDDNSGSYFVDADDINWKLEGKEIYDDLNQINFADSCNFLPEANSFLWDYI